VKVTKNIHPHSATDELKMNHKLSMCESEREGFRTSEGTEEKRDTQFAVCDDDDDEMD
jgi:hypothetical protein